MQLQVLQSLLQSQKYRKCIIIPLYRFGEDELLLWVLSGKLYTLLIISDHSITIKDGAPSSKQEPSFCLGKGSC